MNFFTILKSQDNFCEYGVDYSNNLKTSLTTISNADTVDIQRTSLDFFGEFPTSGNFNALAIFIKFKNDNYEDLRTFNGYNSIGEPTFITSDLNYTTDTLVGRKASGFSDSWAVGGQQSWTDDPITEWPRNLPLISTNKQQLPAWATKYIDDVGSSTITSGSLTDAYNRASNGSLNFRGKVYEWTYIPNKTAAEYKSSGGVVELVNEMLLYIQNDAQSSIDLNAPYWDLITSKTKNHVPDGKFDMLLLNFRFLKLKDLDNTFTKYTKASAIAFMFDKLTNSIQVGQYKFDTNSGAINSANSWNGMRGVSMHEIGHRLIGAHTDGLNPSKFDNFSIMMQGPTTRMAMSGRDRLITKWYNKLEIDLSALSSDTITLNINDANGIHSNNETDLILIKRSPNDYEGALVIESITKNTPWTEEPNHYLSDGDGDDTFLPNEGLMFYKLLDRTSEKINSMHANGLRRKFLGMNDYQAFGVGDAYTPFSIVTNYLFNTGSIDHEVAITDIIKTSTGYSFKVHKNFLQSSTETKKLTTRFSFNSNTIAKNTTSTWQLGGRFIMSKAANLSNFTILAAPNVDWNGFLINESNGISNSNFYISNATIAQLKGNPNWSQYPGQAIISVYDGKLTLSNVNIHSEGTQAAIGVSGVYGELILNNTDIHTQQGAGILGTNNGVVYVRNSEISSSGTNNPLIQAKFGGMVSAWLPPWLYNGYQIGYNKLQGGSYGIDVTNNSIVRFGEGSNSNNSNYFYDSNSKKIRVSNGGTAYIKYNYWNNYTPTLINQGGSIYYSNSLGNAQGNILGSGGYMAANSNSDEKILQLEKVNDITEKKVFEYSRDPWLLAREKQSISSNLKQEPSEISESISKLSPTEKKLYYLYEKVLNEGVSALLSNKSDFKQKMDENTWSHLLYTGIRVSLAQGDSAIVRILLSEPELTISESWKPVINEITSQLSSINRYENESSLGSDLVEIYPNPFNPSTTISIKPNQTGVFNLTIFNLLGQKITSYKALAQENVTFTYSFEASALATGVYLLQIDLGNQVLSKKLYLIK